MFYATVGAGWVLARLSSLKKLPPGKRLSLAMAGLC